MTSETHDIPEHKVYEAIGEDGMARLVRAFYRQVPDDDILGSMYPENDLSGAEARLLGFLTFRFGGPQSYLAERGHPRLRMRHAPFQVDQAARDRWLKLMWNAFEEAALPNAAEKTMKAFFAQVATFLINSHPT